VVIQIFAVLAVSSTRKEDRELKKLIKSTVKEDEYAKNILKVFSWNLRGQEEEAAKLCNLVKEMRPTILGLQQIRLTSVRSLNFCFRELNKELCTFKRVIRVENGKRIYKQVFKEKCGYKVIGAGSSNNGDLTLFTPVIFNRRRGIREADQSGTFWLSETPSEAFTKLDRSSEMRIASWAKLKVAVMVKPVENRRKGFSRFLNILKKTGNRKPTTKWIELMVVNSQLDDQDVSVAEEQLEILLKVLKGGEEDSALILNIGINPKHTEKLSAIMENNGNFVNTRKNTRIIPKAPSSPEESTMSWSKGLENMFFTNAEDDKAQGAGISVLLYK